MADSVFQNLNKSYVTTGILYDRVFPFATLHTFNTPSQDTASTEQFLQGGILNSFFDNDLHAFLKRFT
ncbi:MAG: hypothetical protein ABIY62_09440, partial [Ginsengibacter sp.]